MKEIKDAKTQDESKPILHRPQDLPIYSTVHTDKVKRYPFIIHYYLSICFIQMWDSNDIHVVHQSQKLKHQLFDHQLKEVLKLYVKLVVIV